MNRRTILASLVVFLAGVVVGLAQVDATAFMGTWKLDEAKSKLAPGSTKATTVVYSGAADNQVKVTVDGTDKDGKPVHSEWTGKFDGKDYPVMGSPVANTWSYIPSGKHSLSMTQKKDGKTVATGKITVALDGKTRTVTMSGAEPSMNYTAEYTKQ